MPYSDREKQVAASKRFRERAVASGLCCRCAKIEPSGGRKTCDTCIDYVRNRKKGNRDNENRHERKRRERLTEQGRCTRCGRQSAEGYYTCGVCFESRRIQKMVARSLDG